MIALTRNGLQPEPRSPGVVASGAAAVARPGEQHAPASTPNAADVARDRSVEAPLDRGQKAALVILAKQAWERIRLVDDSVADLDTWRQEQATLACGRRISEAQVKHFSAIKRHFANLTGDAGQAFQSAMREGTEAERIAMMKLQEACAQRGLDMSYPASIARKQFKGAALKDLPAKKLWCLVFTIRNRRKPARAEKTVAPTKGQRTRDYTLKPAAPAAPKPTTVEEEGDPF